MAGILAPGVSGSIFQAAQRSGIMSRSGDNLTTNYRTQCNNNVVYSQEKLPKSQRRPVPTAPENFDKVSIVQKKEFPDHFPLKFQGYQRRNQGQGACQDEPESV